MDGIELFNIASVPVSRYRWRVPIHRRVKFNHVGNGLKTEPRWCQDEDIAQRLVPLHIGVDRAELPLRVRNVLRLKERGGVCPLRA